MGITREEYLKEINRLEQALDENNAETYNNLFDFQHNYMTELVNSVDTSNEVGQIISEILYDVIDHSFSGNVCIDLKDLSLERQREVGEKVVNWLYDNGLLLDENENILYDKWHNTYVVDVMFGGAFVPGWDGYGF